jgi:hypothetical protein
MLQRRKTRSKMGELLYKWKLPEFSYLERISTQTERWKHIRVGIRYNGESLYTLQSLFVKFKETDYYSTRVQSVGTKQTAIISSDVSPYVSKIRTPSSSSLQFWPPPILPYIFYASRNGKSKVEQRNASHNRLDGIAPIDRTIPQGDQH